MMKDLINLIKFEKHQEELKQLRKKNMNNQ